MKISGEIIKDISQQPPGVKRGSPEAEEINFEGVLLGLLNREIPIPLEEERLNAAKEEGKLFALIQAPKEPSGKENLIEIIKNEREKEIFKKIPQEIIKNVSSLVEETNAKREDKNPQQTENNPFEKIKNILKEMETNLKKEGETEIKSVEPTQVKEGAKEKEISREMIALTKKTEDQKQEGEKKEDFIPEVLTKDKTQEMLKDSITKETFEPAIKPTTQLKKEDSFHSNLHPQSEFVSEESLKGQGKPPEIEVKNMQEVVTKMISQIKELKEGERSILQVKLNPKELGDIEIKLEIKAGEIIGKILVDNSTVKGHFESQIQQIKDNLKNQNIILEDIEVDIQQHFQEQREEKRHTQYPMKEFHFSSDNKETEDPEESLKLHTKIYQLKNNSYYNRDKIGSLSLLV